MTEQKFELVIEHGELLYNYVAKVVMDSGEIVAKNTFTWNPSSVATELDLFHLSEEAIGKPQKGPSYKDYGKKIFNLVFYGEIRQFWLNLEKSSEINGETIHIIIRTDIKTASPLLKIAWEYLHDGENFIIAKKNVRMSRFPWSIESPKVTEIENQIRVLICIPSPIGLSQNEMLNSSYEEDVILMSLSEAITKQNIKVRFTLDGTLQTLSKELEEFDPHILHFSSHGVFLRLYDKGYLLMENNNGAKAQVDANIFLETVSHSAKNIRLIILSACQSASASRNESYLDIGTKTLLRGIPALIGMQFSIFNNSAIEFMGELYLGIANGEGLHSAVSKARQKISGQLDFATPVLFLSNADCLKLSNVKQRRSEKLRQSNNPSILPPLESFVGRRNELRWLQSKLSPNEKNSQSVFLFGISGIGKSALSLRLAWRMSLEYDYIFIIKLASQKTVSAFTNSLLDELRNDSDYVIEFKSRIKAIADDVSVGVAKTFHLINELVAFFQSIQSLIVIDDFQNAYNFENQSFEDPDFINLIIKILSSSDQTRVLMISNKFIELSLFSQTEELNLHEMEMRDSMYFIELSESKNKGDVFFQEGANRVIIDLYKMFGGHPSALRQALEILMNENTQTRYEDYKQILEKIALNLSLGTIFEGLSDKELSMLKRLTVFDDLIPVEAPVFLEISYDRLFSEIGSTKNTKGFFSGEQEELFLFSSACFVDAEDKIISARDTLNFLCNEGLVYWVNDDYFKITTLVKNILLMQISEEDKEFGSIQIGIFYYFMAIDRQDPYFELLARNSFFEGRDYEFAAETSFRLIKYLLRSGEYDLILKLMDETIKTVSGSMVLLARANYAIALFELGKLSESKIIFHDLIDNPEFNKLGFDALADIYYYLGGIYDLGGVDTKAFEYYEKSLQFSKQCEDRAGEAAALQALGIYFQQRKQLDKSEKYLYESLEIKKNLNDPIGLASIISQLGILADEKEEYKKAFDFQKQSLDIRSRFGDKPGMAISLHQLGILFEKFNKPNLAWFHYNESMKISEEIGDISGVSSSLHHIGTLYYRNKNYEEAYEFLSRSFEISDQLGDLFGKLSSLSQMGLTKFALGDFDVAEKDLLGALSIAQDLNITSKMGELYAHIGFLKVLQGLFTDSTIYFRNAINIREKNKTDDLIGFLFGAGVQLLKTNQIKESMQYFSEAYLLSDRPSLSTENLDTYNKYRLSASAFIGDYKISGLSTPLMALTELLKIKSQIGGSEFDNITKDHLWLGSYLNPFAVLNNALEEFEQKISNMIDANQNITKDETDKVTFDILIRRTVAAVRKESVMLPNDIWLRTLDIYKEMGRSNNDEDTVNFISILQKLIQGEDITMLSERIPDKFLKVWKEIVSGVQK